MMKILNRLFNKSKKDRTGNRIIKVRLSSMLGDTERLMTILELKKDYKEYIITDNKSGNQIDIEKLVSSDIEDVVVKKREEECC